MDSHVERYYETMSIHMENYVHRFRPGSWIKPIGNVFPRAFIDSSTAKRFHKAYKNGALDEALVEKGKCFAYPAYIVAVTSFFDTRDMEGQANL